MKKIFNCKELIMDEFDKSVKEGMVTAEILLKRPTLNIYQLSTIKTSLSRLKKEKKLMIAFRMQSRIDGLTKKHIASKCYYKLK